MKQLSRLSFASLFVLIGLAGLTQATPAKRTETKAKVKTQNLKMKVKGDLTAVPLPYPVYYSSQFIIGDPANAKRVLDMWKDSENNTLGRDPNAFADTIALQMPDGTWLRGQSKVLLALNAHRSSLGPVERTVSVVLSVHSIDRDEDWVLVWGQETGKNEDGTKKITGLHEACRLNKNGQIDMLLRFHQAAAKM